MPETYSGTITLVSVADGTDGLTYYTWIRYSNGASSNPSVTPSPQADTKQIGFAYNKTSSTPTSNYNDYVWSDYIGTDGTDGEDGIGISSIIEQYNLSSSNTQAPGELDTNWKNTPDPWQNGKYYWTRSKITWTNNNISYTNPVLAQGLNSANSNAYSATTDLAAYMQRTDATLGNLQNQLDGQVEVWYFEVNPGTSTDPSASWMTPEEKARHIGDLYYNVSNGHSWRWLDQGASENPRYIWQQIPDSDAAAALAAAQAAQTTANNKRRIFTAQPTTPYDVGDLWVNGSTVKYCQTARTEGQSYNAADWTLTATDDTWAQQNAIVQVDVYYAKNNSSTTAPAGYNNPAASSNWSTDPPQWTDGDFIWSVTVTTKNGQDIVSDPVCITGAKGATGATGATGNGISSVTVTYGTSSSGTDPATVTQWSSTVPAVTQGNYLWTKTVVNYTNGTSSNPSYSAVYHSEDGKAPIYDIELSDEKIYKSVQAENNNSVKIVPQQFSFEVFKTETGNRANFNDFYYDIGIIGSDKGEGSGEQGSTNPYESLKTLLGNSFNTYLPKSSNKVTFLLSNFLSASFTGNLAGFQSEIREKNIYFLIKVWTGSATYDASKVICKAVVCVEFANDLAVSITNSILQATMAGESKKLQFDLDGLTIYNSGLKIISQEDPDVEGTTLLEYDEANQTLKIKGSGEFSGELVAASGSFEGTVTATDGEFNGTINANAGRIGNFIIEEDGLYSNPVEGNEEPTIRLSGGADGSIYANNITLGDNAVINGTLKAGKIGSSDNYYTQLSNSGTLTLGGLTLEGSSSTISANNGSFRIRPDFAEFNNIIAKGKISTSVFETNRVQTVGGTMVFKPSFKIHHIENNKIYIDASEPIGESDLNGDYIYFVAENGSLIGGPDLYQIALNDGTVRQGDFFVLSLISGQSVPNDAENLPFSLIDLGQDKDIIVGINSNNAVSDFLYGRGMTISQMNVSGSSASFDLKAFLGDLEVAGLGSGYGLYSSNVYLTGSLITRTVSGGNSFYAGVNTLNGISADEDLVGDNSEIIFWAGSEDNSDDKIRQAPFQVTREGAIYAQKGKFEGAIISKSTIQGASIVGADIYAATIHGTGNDPCLKIYDITGAIGFFNENTDTQVLTIDQGGFKYLGNDFITLSNSSNVITAKAYFDEYYTNNLLINSDEISYRQDTNRNLDFNDDLAIKLSYNTDTYMSLGEQEILLKDTIVTVDNIFTLHNMLQYKPKYDGNSLIGYDLYIN